jgi:HK97 family phage portal protein
MGLFTRAIRPPPDEIPNDNDPATVPPATVGPPAYNPGDPDGFVLEGEPHAGFVPPRIVPSAWSGWPAEWATPNWNGQPPTTLGDTAWACLDLNASVLSTMPPYLVGASPSLDDGWLTNPDPILYTSWEEFAKQLFWDYQAVGESFVYATARYATGWPARFHVLPPWSVNVEMDDGRRRYTLGEIDVTQDILHIRYQSSVGDARGHGPLEAGASRVVAADVLTRYATTLVGNGGIPTSILRVSPDANLSDEQILRLKQDWVTARASSIGEPAVLTGGAEWEAVQLDPEKMALVDLARHNESRIAILLGVPPHLVGLPSSGDSMTYANVSAIFDYHWRSGLRPKAATVMSALSGWLLPRGSRVELNRDEYVQPGPYERAQTDAILHGIVDTATGQPAKSVSEIREAERFTDPAPELVEGVLR